MFSRRPQEHEATTAPAVTSLCAWNLIGMYGFVSLRKQGTTAPEDS